MRTLPDRDLIDAYLKAKELSLSEEFILLLKAEIERRTLDVRSQ